AYDKKKHPKGPPRIEEAIKEGDEVLVQVVKDPMGAKGARLTGNPSLPGRYLVLVPDSDTNGISRRLPEEERIRLREIIEKVKPEGFGVIVRTAALHASAEDIAADISRLVKIWDEIKEKAAHGGAPRVIYEEPDLLIRVIREHFTPDSRRMLVEDREAYEKVVEYLRATAPDLVSKVHLYEDEMPLFERYHVDDQLRKALERRVYLPSGGHLVIDRTEALTVIDVNTGKFVGSSSLEETVLQNNLEAAEEIGRQLRLRDIGGIIVIDFIDMEKEKNQQLVLRKLKETLAEDKTRTQVFDVSQLGLVEMTRENVSAGLLEHFSEPCPHCEGRGVLLNEEAVKNGIPVVSTAVDAERHRDGESGQPASPKPFVGEGAPLLIWSFVTLLRRGQFMYAIIRAGGKQAKVRSGDVIQVERVKNAGETIEFRPLLVVDDDGNTFSSPSDLENATVTAKVLGEVKGDKVEIFKYKPKTGYRRRMGHRHTYTQLEITGIALEQKKKSQATRQAKKAEEAEAADTEAASEED